MRGRKVYGSYQTAACPFCGKSAYAKNKDGVAVCADHKNAQFGDMKCVCGSFLEQKTGKFGAFFICENCGPVNMNKAININDGAKKKQTAFTSKPKSFNRVGGREEEVVDPNDPRYFS